MHAAVELRWRELRLSLLRIGPHGRRLSGRPFYRTRDRLRRGLRALDPSGTFGGCGGCGALGWRGTLVSRLTRRRVGARCPVRRPLARRREITRIPRGGARTPGRPFRDPIARDGTRLVRARRPVLWSVEGGPGKRERAPGLVGAAVTRRRQHRRTPQRIARLAGRLRNGSIGVRAPAIERIEIGGLRVPTVLPESAAGREPEASKAAEAQVWHPVHPGRRE
jgi:hypothetical protein